MGTIQLPATYQDVRKFDAFRVQELPEHVRARPNLDDQLEYLNRTGYLRRIRKGLYGVVPLDQVGAATYVPDRFVIASLLTRPYAISFLSALEFHGLGEGLSRRVYVQGPRRFQGFSFDQVEYCWVRENELFGIEQKHRGRTLIAVTDVERTLLDCLRKPSYAGGLDELFRALEGLQKLDLLSEVLERTRSSGRPPRWSQLRADLEDRRAELDQLKTAGLIWILPDQSVYLTLLGLSFCSHLESDEEIKIVRKVFDRLRRTYKLDSERAVNVQDAARETGSSVQEITRALFILWCEPFAAGVGGTFPNYSIKVGEPILDTRDLDQLLAKKLETFKLPKELSLVKRGLAFVRFDRLLEYLKMFDDGSLYQKVGFVLTMFRAYWQVPQDVLRVLAKHVGNKKYYFPPKLKRGAGRLVRNWNLIVPTYLHTRYLAAAEQGEGAVDAV